MNVTDAVYRAVHGYPGGSEALAPRMGLPAATLRNKVNPKNPSHRVYIEDLDQIMGLTGDYSPLEALAAGHGFVLRAAAPEGTTECLVQAMLASQTTRGTVWIALQQALVDNVVTPNEFAAIDAALARAQAADRQLLEVLRGLVPKPPVGRE